MKSIISLSLIIGAFLMLAVRSDAQRKFLKVKTERTGLQQVKTFTGQIIGWVDNDNYLNDGFYLQTSKEKLLVKFPPHLGAQLTKSINLGNEITVKAVEMAAPDGSKKLRFVSAQVNEKIIYDTPPIVQDRTIEKEFMIGSGKISELQTNKNGKVRGYVVDEKTILHISPNVAFQLNKVVFPGVNIAYTGVKRNQQEGEVATANFTIIECQTITINGKQYLAR